eukprot:623702_1
MAEDNRLPGNGHNRLNSQSPSVPLSSSVSSPPVPIATPVHKGAVTKTIEWILGLFDAKLRYVLLSISCLIIFVIPDIAALIISYSNTVPQSCFEHQILIHPQLFLRVGAWVTLAISFIAFIATVLYLKDYTVMDRMCCCMCQCICAMMQCIAIWSIFGFVIYSEMDLCHDSAIAIIIFIWSVAKLLLCVCSSCCLCKNVTRNMHSRFQVKMESQRHGTYGTLKPNIVVA